MSQSSEVLDASESKASVECDSQVTANISNPPDGGMSEAYLVAEGIPPWLDSLMKKGKGGDDDILVSIVIVLIYECGFTTKETSANATGSFDVRIMRELPGLTPVWQEPTSFWASFSLAGLVNVLKLVAVPMGDLMMVTFCIARSEASSIVLRASRHISRNRDLVRLSDLTDLSNTVKTICGHFRDRILEENGVPAPLTLTTLPYEIVLHICDFLDVNSFRKLCSTCGFLHDTVYADETLWMKYAKRFFPVSIDNKGSLSWKNYVLKSIEIPIRWRNRRCQCAAVSCGHLCVTPRNFMTNSVYLRHHFPYAFFSDSF